MQRDPIHHPWEGAYTAFGNNPVMFTDPLGLTKKNQMGFDNGAGSTPDRSVNIGNPDEVTAPGPWHDNENSNENPTGSSSTGFAYFDNLQNYQPQLDMTSINIPQVQQSTPNYYINPKLSDHSTEQNSVGNTEDFEQRWKGTKKNLDELSANGFVSITIVYINC